MARSSRRVCPSPESKLLPSSPTTRPDLQQVAVRLWSRWLDQTVCCEPTNCTVSNRACRRDRSTCAVEVCNCMADPEQKEAVETERDRERVAILGVCDTPLHRGGGAGLTRGCTLAGRSSGTVAGASVGRLAGRPVPCEEAAAHTQPPRRAVHHRPLLFRLHRSGALVGGTRGA